MQSEMPDEGFHGCIIYNSTILKTTKASNIKEMIALITYRFVNWFIKYKTGRILKVDLKSWF